MPGGQPSQYTSPEMLESAVEGYFAQAEVPTLSGLALHLGFSDRHSLYDQRDRGPEYSAVYKRAVARVAAVHEARLMGAQQTAGSIFWLKNHGWADKTETQLSGSVEVTQITRTIIDPKKDGS